MSTVPAIVPPASTSPSTTVAAVPLKSRHKKVVAIGNGVRAEACMLASTATFDRRGAAMPMALAAAPSRRRRQALNPPIHPRRKEP